MSLSSALSDFEPTEPGLPTPGSTLSSTWAARRARALALAAEVPEVEGTLSTYADLLESQARVADAVPVRRWLALVAAEGGPPRLRLDRLPVDELVPLFADFLSATSSLGGEHMRADAGILTGAPGADWLALFGAALEPHRPDEDAPFHVRAFLQAVATALAHATAEGRPTAKGGRCLTCGGPAVVAAVTEHAGAAGRSLLCAVCGTAWLLPRPACARCGEDAPGMRFGRKAAALPWVRAEACRRCERYLKLVDLRIRPDAEPLVEDLASVELDAWARAHGFVRVQETLFGGPATA